MQDFVLQSGNRVELLVPNHTPDTSPEGGQSVVPKVEAILAINSLQEQIDFCFFESRKIVHDFNIRQFKQPRLSRASPSRGTGVTDFRSLHSALRCRSVLVQSSVPSPKKAENAG